MGSLLSSLSRKPEAQPSSSETSTRVMSFHSLDDWQLYFNECKESSELLVIDFAASWCGPCKFMEPAVNEMANKFQDVRFAKIDVDELSDVARELKVEAMPTFVLMKKGREVDRLVGAKKDELQKKIKKCKAL